MRAVMNVFILILILSVVQSLFGVGLLLFGTPILLLMGLPYTEVLLYLLPASAALSWSQVKDLSDIKLNGNYRKFFFLICLPALVVGMIASNRFDFKWEIRLFVTFMLVMVFVLRTSTILSTKLQLVMKKNLIPALGLMGLIHGLSNMGGSVLTPLVSSLYKDKNKVLAGISFDYAFMASVQLIVLILIQGEQFRARYLMGTAISLTVRYMIGRKVFAFTSQRNYQNLLNGFILANAFLLGINLLK
jgi:uncharacterized protein